MVRSNDLFWPTPQAGKTTVIAPMLALMLADGKRLVTQVVPAQLLSMSRGVLRECFSNVVVKRIYTLFFSRANSDLAASGTLQLDAMVIWSTPQAHSGARSSVVDCFVQHRRLVARYN